jgi:hypothetical protein
MAVDSTQIKSSLTIKYKDGVDSNGKDILKTKKYSNIKLTAADQNLLDVATAFNPLMKYPIQEVVRSNDSVLVNA